MNTTTINSFFSRNELFLGARDLELLRNAKVFVMGIGGVGSVICEQLVRLGLKDLSFAGRGHYDYGNINRQIPATYINVRSKVKKIHALSLRLLNINPIIKINCYDYDILKEKDKIQKMIENQSIDIIFNCVDEYKAQNIIAQITHNAQVAMMIGGVIGIGDKGIITTFGPNIDYFDYFNLNKENNIILDDSIIKAQWISTYGPSLKPSILNRYNSNNNIPYPVITPLPWIIASFMIIEFIKMKLSRYKPILAPYYLEIIPFISDVKIKQFKTNEDNHEYIPWRP